MKKILTLLALGLVFSAHKCSNGTDATSMAGLMDTKWMLQSLSGKPIEVTSSDQTPWVQLAGGENNQVKGFGGCNNLMGSFTMDGDRIGFPGLGSTKMFCEKTADLEKNFMTALRSTDSYKLDGGTLRLMQGATEVATLVQGK